MSTNSNVTNHQFILEIIYDTMDINCNVSFCERPRGPSTAHTNVKISTKETYLERALGFLVIGIIGTIANAFVILVLGSSVKIRQKLVNTLIIHQSFVDLLTSVLLIGTAHIDGLDQHGLGGIHAAIYCFFLMAKWPLWVMMDVSSFSLMFLNIERYISIVHPIYHHTKVTRKKVSMLLPIVWFLGLLEQCLISTNFEAQHGACGFVKPELFQVIVISFLILHFFLPVLLVIVLYGHIIIKLRVPVSYGKNTTSGNRNEVMEKAKKNVLKTMLFITICYAVCYVFNSVYIILMIMGILENLSGMSTDLPSRRFKSFRQHSNIQIILIRVLTWASMRISFTILNCSEK